MVDLVEKRIQDVEISTSSNYAIVLIAHGSFSYTKAHDELKEFSENESTCTYLLSYAIW